MFINNISTGSCAIKYWTNRIEENVFGLTQRLNRCPRSCEKKSGY